MCHIDPDRLSLALRTAPNRSAAESDKPPLHKRGEKFLKGPVPLDWLAHAGQLPGKALHVGNALWFLAGLKRSATVPLANSVLAQFGVDRHAKRRALLCLEREGLIRVKRQPGRSPVVTILEDTK